MIVKVRGILLRFTEYQNEIEVEAKTVRDGLDRLTDLFPRLREVLMDREDEVRATHFIALNGEQLAEDEFDREVAEDDRVDIVTAVSGG